jgi:precorrin-4 methylase
MTVHFIGAGPGAADLITLRGRDLIARCPVCLYAGSIVPPELLAHCPPGARIVDTAPLSLDEIDAEFAAAHAADFDVARLHSGDLSIYSALAEQLRRLKRRGIPYTLTPGVPAFAAAAAAPAIPACSTPRSRRCAPAAVSRSTPSPSKPRRSCSPGTRRWAANLFASRLRAPVPSAEKPAGAR